MMDIRRKQDTTHRIEPFRESTQVMVLAIVDYICTSNSSPEM